MITITNPYRGVNLQLGCESTSRSFQLGMGPVIVKTDCCQWIVRSTSSALIYYLEAYL